MRFTLKKSEILRGGKNFEHLLKNSKKFEGKLLRCYMATKPGEVKRSTPGVMVAFAVKKTFKRAVDRNRIRRLMREAYRLNKSLLVSHISDSDTQMQLFFVYPSPRNTTCALPTFAAIREDILMVLSSIAKTALERV